jgi:hypothetical protein
MDYKVGNKVFVPKLNKSGEIIAIREFNNSYTMSTYYYILLDSDLRYADKRKNPCIVLTQQNLHPDEKKIIQLSLFS